MLKKRLPLICGLLRVLPIVLILLLTGVACHFVSSEVVRSEICMPLGGVMFAFIGARIVGHTHGWSDVLPYSYSIMFAAAVLGIVALSTMSYPTKNIGIVIAAIMIPSLPEFVRLVLVETAYKNGWKWPENRWCALF